MTTELQNTARESLIQQLDECIRLGVDLNDLWDKNTALMTAAQLPPVPDFRGYAAMGTGQYLLHACPATEGTPPELVISIATDEEKQGRDIGDLKDIAPGTLIQPEVMAVRLAFFSVAGLDALEQQLRILREESFPESIKPKKNQVTLSGKDIRELAEFAGLVIAENDYTDEYETLMVVEDGPAHGVVMDDLAREHYALIAYLEEYPEEGVLGLGEGTPL